MDFFGQQDFARRRTKWLVAYFIVALVLITISVYGLFMTCAVVVSENTKQQNPNVVSFADQMAAQYYFSLPVLAATLGFVFLTVGSGSLFKIYELSAGGGATVAMSLGGREVLPTTTDPTEKRLRNVVEEMAIASGITVPLVYVLENERGINAFAAGLTPNTAVVAVTRGTLEYLSRDELQGVVAHEFSHILNGDMRLNLRLIGVLFGLNLMIIFGYEVMRFGYYASLGSRGGGKDKGGAMAAMAAIMLGGMGVAIIGSVGRFFSMLIQAAISRQREFLADASAVQFTRNPDGIAGALVKIGSPQVGSKFDAPRAMEASHLFFSNGLSSAFSGTPFATHPPLPIRIKQIHPQFDGRFPTKIERLLVYDPNSKDFQQRQTEQWNTSADVRARSGGGTLAGKLGGLGGIGGKIGGGQVGGNSAAAALGRIGMLDMPQLIVAASLLDAVPETARELSNTETGARATVFALLLDSENKTVFQKQWDWLTANESPECLAQAQQFLAVGKTLPMESRLPMVQHVFPVLRNMKQEEYTKFRKSVKDCIAASGQMNLFEFAIHTMLLNELDVLFGLSQPVRPQYYNINGVRDAFAVVLSYLAYNGTDDYKEAQFAFTKGLEAAGQSVPFIPQTGCTLQTFADSLKKINFCSMQVKKQLLGGFFACISADNVITPREGELIRVICGVLGCPMPFLAA